MTKTEINSFLEKISTENILNAFQKLDEDGSSSKSKIRQYVIRHEGKTYPPPETLRVAYEYATGDKLPMTFFENIGEDSEQFKFVRELGFILDKVDQKFKYYLKKVSNQDVTKTTVINSESLTSFFGLNLTDRDDEGIISIKYLSDGTINDNVIIKKKQDLRIFIDRGRFKESDLLFFSTQGNNLFNLDIIDNYNSKYKYYNSILKNNYLLTNNLLVQNDNMVNDTTPKYDLTTTQPLNQILFGPPGTGKTYTTITKALNILGLLEEKESYTKEEYENAQKVFQNELGKRIEFVTMHQSFSYEDFVQGLKPLKSKEVNGISFDYKNGVFKNICERADILRLENNFDETKGRVDFEVVYNYSFKSLFEDNETITINRGKTKFVIYEFSDKTLWFETSNGTTHPRYTLAKKTLKKIYDSKVNTIIKSGNKGYFDAALDFLLDNEKKIIENSKNQTLSQNSNFVIILDEINRANISRVFGELIALIEEDKRDGNLTVTLPSGDRFTVPSNLYIIGTMNTADKSIALVDIALRRRFKFIPLYPDLKRLKSVLNENKFDSKEIETRVNLLTNLNKIIRAKKSVDFEIGHSYFMGKDKLIDILNDQTLPLLNEYFMYNLTMVKDIIEKQQKDNEGNNIPKLGINLNKKVWNERGLLEVESVDSLLEQIQADVNSTSNTTELNNVDSNI